MAPQQPCQNVLAGDNFAVFSQLLFAAFFTLDFPKNLLVGWETQSLFPTAFIMLPVTANHFDRAAPSRGSCDIL